MKRTEKKKLTDAQRRAIHLHCEQLCDALKNEGATVQDVLSKSIERHWTKLTIKDLLWKDIASRAFGAESTEDLETEQITAVYDVINKFTSTHWGIHIPFPSMETLSEKQRDAA